MPEHEFSLPLMENNITADDLAVLIDFLKGNPRLTQSNNVQKFEEEWSNWLGVKYSVYVNSGASANLLTIAALKHLYGGGGEIIVPTLTWVSDIAAVMQNGFTPVFIDINPRNLGMDENQIFAAITPQTRAVFVTYVQGFNCLSDRLLNELKHKNIMLLEDVCESHGATFKERKLGSFGFASNFSYYFAHHMSTIEGGMVCTNDRDFYEAIRMFRSHGMVRESADEVLKKRYAEENPELSPDFIFAFPAYNARGTEIGGVLGRTQLKKLDANNKERQQNFKTFLQYLDGNKYRTDFDAEGSCNYAFPLILKTADPEFRARVEATMRDNRIEFRRGSSGGGNQTRQPYLKGFVQKDEWLNYPEIEHVHFYGYYIGNYPSLTNERIKRLCEILNSVF